MDMKSDLALKVENQECAGAVSIIIQDKESRSRAGVAVLYRDSNKIRSRSTNKNYNDNNGDGDGDGDDDAAEGLTLLVTDGNGSYHCEIDLSHIKMTKAQIQQDFESAPSGIGPNPSSNSHSHTTNRGGRWKESPTKSEWVSQILLQSNSTDAIDKSFSGISQSSKTSVTYKYKSNEGDVDEESRANGIEMSMKHSRGSIVRVISKQHIQKKLGTLGSLPFIQAITASLTLARQQETMLSLDLQKTSKRLSSWKRTAEQLHDSKWQKERDQLMNNFLTLLNNTKGTLRDVQSQLKEQQQNNLKLQEKIKRLESGKHMQREIVMDHVDEHDCQLFDKKMVDMLAGNTTSANNKSTNESIGMRKNKADGKAALKSSSTAAAASRAPEDRTRKRKLSNTVSLVKTANSNKDYHTIRVAKTGASQSYSDEENNKSKNGGVGKINESTQSQFQSLSQSCSQSSQQSWRKNQYTGSIEMWGVEAILQDGDEAKPAKNDGTKK
uniref:Uncharacterized protein n=1 Tax=Chaetoceros debilis TaxID=122233 RepID=A0A7S3VB80_9STRA